jgi:DNA helicase II / ATP-dependent DNA helicase PcrA
VIGVVTFVGDGSCGYEPVYELVRVGDIVFLSRTADQPDRIEPRRAVQYGVCEKDAVPGRPLLVIAGAGSGKTNTLAHRVAHLIVNGADPRRILLMTFSRRTAAEMTRRVERIARLAIGESGGAMNDALTWAGTFHGIGARILRAYAGEIGLDPAFTIHDREDSADLMNLIRHELGFFEDGKPLPCQGHLSCDLFPLRQRGAGN